LKIVSLLLTLFLSLVSASSQSQKNLISSINKDLKTYKNLATKTKTNKHYQPYIVSVLYHDTLKKLGCDTLLDAIKLIPNIDISSDNINYKSIIFRGSNPVSFGQSKLFIDENLVNNIYFDGYSEYLSMPIDLIKRIEVIRGPGSKIDGIPSYAGSIHVITFAEDMKKDSLFFKSGSYDYKLFGFTKKFYTDNLKLFTDFYYKEDDKHVFVPSDALAQGIFNYPMLGIDNKPLSSPANIPLDLQNYSLGISANYKKFYMKSRFFSYKQGSAFGLNYIPSTESNYLNIPNHYFIVGYEQNYKKFSYDIKFGYNYNAIDTQAKLAPNYLQLPKASDPTQVVTFVDGIYGENTATQKNYFHSLSFIYKNKKDHTITSSYYISYTKTSKVVSKITDRDTGVGLTDYTQTLPFFDIDAKRNGYILNISDKYRYTKKIQILYGLSYENNTHISSPQVEPNFALVYNVDDDNILKFLYARSHRTPSWQELYTINNHARVGNKKLKVEKVDTFETSYIRHFSNDNFVQSSLFYTINKDQIHNYTQNNRFVNSDDTNRLYGMEVELKSHFGSKDKIYLNFSYTDGQNTSEHTFALVSHKLAKAYYIYDLKENLSLSTVLTYASEKKRLPHDSRENIPSCTVIDTALNYKNFKKDLNINFSIKNITDKKIVYPSKPNTYEGDYPTVGRSFILSFSKGF